MSSASDDRRKQWATLIVVGLMAGFIFGFLAGARADATCAGGPTWAGCTKAQVLNAARTHRRAWYRHRSFGQVHNVLGSLSLRHQRMVKRAFRGEIRDKFRAQAAKGALVNGGGELWRGQRYSIASFPYRRYANTTFNAAGPGGSCYAAAYGGYANHWCSHPPTGWQGYWAAYYHYLKRPQVSVRIYCAKEVVVATSGEAVAGGVLGAFAGPGTAAGGAAIGALTGFTSTTAGCIVAKLGDLAGAW